MEKPLQPCKTDYVRSSALPAAEVTTIVRCLNAKTLLVRQLPLVFMPACQWRLTNSRVSVRRGERQLFAARHATIDSGGRVTLANYSQHIFKCAWKAGWPAATGVDTPQTAGYHRGIPEAEVTPPHHHHHTLHLPPGSHCCAAIRAAGGSISNTPLS